MNNRAQISEQLDSDPSTRFIQTLQQELDSIQQNSDSRPGLFSLTNKVSALLTKVLGPERAYKFISTYTTQTEAFDVVAINLEDEARADFFAKFSNPQLRPTEFPGLIIMSWREVEKLANRYENILNSGSEKANEYYESTVNFMRYLITLKVYIETLTEPQLEILIYRYQNNHLNHTENEMEVDLYTGFIQYLEAIKSPQEN